MIGYMFVNSKSRKPLHSCVDYNLLIPDIHGVNLSGSKSLPNLANLYSRANQAVQRSEDRGTSPSHIFHWRQQLHKYETLWPGPMYCDQW